MFRYDIGSYKFMKNIVGNIRKRNNRLTFIPDSETITHPIKITNMNDTKLTTIPKTKEFTTEDGLVKMNFINSKLNFNVNRFVF